MLQAHRGGGSTSSETGDLDTGTETRTPAPTPPSLLLRPEVTRMLRLPPARVSSSLCVCVCVCVCARARARARAYVWRGRWGTDSSGTFSVFQVLDKCCVRAKSLQSCPTLYDPVDCSPPGSSVHGILQAKNTGVGGHALLQGIFLTQGSNPSLLQLLHCRQILDH